MFISSLHLHTEATAECDYPFLFCSAVKKCCPSLYRRGEFELLISICERKETFAHSSFWRAYCWRTPFYLHSSKLKNSRSQPSYPPLRNVPLTSHNKDTAWWSTQDMKFSSLLQVWGDIKKRGGSLSLKHEPGRRPAGGLQGNQSCGGGRGSRSLVDLKIWHERGV